MISLSSRPPAAEADRDDPMDGVVANPNSNASCYSITIFTQRWKEVRDFYVDILGAEVLSERAERYCEVNLGGVPLTIRMAEYNEIVSYFHLYLSMKNRDAVLNELRRRGIIVTTVGPYTNFRDPEGRVIKLSENKTIVS
jgi:catechol 2,3-dioxygenase-like lactoylglutathione lyase family enzyme